MAQAGANGINWIGLMTEWAPDYTTQERAAVNPVILERGGGVGLALEYVRANRSVPAGVA
jgi:hypothetical protein